MNTPPITRRIFHWLVLLPCGVIVHQDAAEPPAGTCGLAWPMPERLPISPQTIHREYVIEATLPAHVVKDCEVSK